MPRSARIVVPGSPHHVVLRGNNRRRIFSFAADFLFFVALLKRAVGRHACALHALILLSNHLHLLVTPFEAVALARFVASVAQPYAQKRNRARGGSGKLFEERFFSKPIESEAQFAVTHAYIDLNAQRAGLVQRPREYRWSSYPLFAADGVAGWAADLEGICVPSGWYLGLASNDETRRQLYAGWVRECAERDRRPDHFEEVLKLEAASQPYHRRLRRPDGKSAG